MNSLTRRLTPGSTRSPEGRKDCVELRAIRKTFGGTPVVDGIDLAIAQGEFFSLLGPSGCGKSTLLRILAGLEAPSAGRVLIDGEDVTSLPASRRPTNMVFQSYAIFPHLDVAGNVGFGLEHERLDSREKRRRVEEAIALVKLSGLESRRSDQLSGGQRQRVALARAIVKRPRVLLLDEPLSALDKNLREQMQAELRGIQGKLGTTFLFVTHDQEEAMFLSDRIAIMNRGRIAQIAEPEALYNAPSDRFVGEFVGSMSFLQGRVLELQQLSCIVEVPGMGRLSGVARQAVRPNEGVTIGIRPEGVRPAQPGDPAAVAATILSTGYVGQKMLCVVQPHETQDPLIMAVFDREKQVELSSRTNGSSIGLLFDERCVHVFRAS